MAIESEYKKSVVTKNNIPSRFKKIESVLSDNNCFDSVTNTIIKFPRIGSFEIYLEDNLIFSKLISKTWPIDSNILNIIKNQLKHEIHDLYTPKVYIIYFIIYNF